MEDHTRNPSDHLPPAFMTLMREYFERKDVGDYLQAYIRDLEDRITLDMVIDITYKERAVFLSCIGVGILSGFKMAANILVSWILPKYLAKAFRDAAFFINAHDPVEVYQVPMDHLTSEEKMFRLFYIQTQLKSRERVCNTIATYGDELAELHLRLWHFAPSILYKEERVIVHDSPVIPSGCMPFDEDVGVIVMGVSWSNLDVVNKLNQKVPNEDVNISLEPQKAIVCALDRPNPNIKKAGEELVNWLTPRSEYELTKYPTHRWYKMPFLLRDYMMSYCYSNSLTYAFGMLDEGCAAPTIPWGEIPHYIRKVVRATTTDLIWKMIGRVQTRVLIIILFVATSPKVEALEYMPYKFIGESVLLWETPNKKWNITGQRISVEGRVGESWLLITRGFDSCLQPAVKTSTAKEVSNRLIDMCILPSFVSLPIADSGLQPLRALGKLEDENSQVSLPGAICGSVVPEVTSNMSLLKMEQGTSSSNGVHKHDKKEHNAHKRQKAEDGGTYLQHNQEHVSTGIYRALLEGHTCVIQN